MIQVMQSGQAGKVKLLLDMYKLRAKIFKERMGWDVDVDMHGLETDDFDVDHAIYFVSVNNEGKVIGNWRIIPTNHLTMIEKIWPEFLEDLNIIKSPMCWEMSRFAVMTDESHSTKESIHNYNKVTAELFCGLTELCVLCGIEEIYTLYNKKIAKILRRINCHPVEVSSARIVHGDETYVGRFVPDKVMLTKLRDASGIQESLIDENDLPYDIQSYLTFNQEEKNHVLV